MKLEEGLRIGRLFESEWTRQAHIIGFHVNRHYDQLGITGTKAPVTSGPFNGYRLPDTTLMRAGDSFWAEAKYKTRPTPYHKNANELQHGIDWPNWCDYLEICKISGQRGYLIIGEGSTGEILIAAFARLQPLTRHYEGTVHFAEGAAFWPRWAFQPFGHFSPQTGQMHFAFRPLRPNAGAVSVFDKDDAA